MFRPSGLASGYRPHWPRLGSHGIAALLVIVVLIVSVPTLARMIDDATTASSIQMPDTIGNWQRLTPSNGTVGAVPIDAKIGEYIVIEWRQLWFQRNTLRAAVPPIKFGPTRTWVYFRTGAAAVEDDRDAFAATLEQQFPAFGDILTSDEERSHR